MARKRTQQAPEIAVFVGEDEHGNKEYRYPDGTGYWELGPSVMYDMPNDCPGCKLPGIFIDHEDMVRGTCPHCSASLSLKASFLDRCTTCNQSPISDHEHELGACYDCHSAALDASGANG